MNLAELRRFSGTVKTQQEIELREKYWREMFKNQLGGPGLHALMKELRAVIDEYDGDRMLVGEDDDIDYMGDGQDELHLVFNFPLANTNRITPEHIRRNQTQRIARLNKLPNGGWACNTLGNHDRSRLYTQFGDGKHDANLARLNAALVLTLKGTPFLYNGEEIGMTDFIITDPARLRDTMATWYYNSLVTDLNVPAEEAALRAGEMTRDKNRTPMHWSNNPNAGFSPADVQTWLPVNPNYARGINVRDQEHNPASLWNYYKLLLNVRRHAPALIEGEYIPLHKTSKDYFAFLRQAPGQTVLVVLNYTEKSLTLDFSRLKDLKGKKLLALFSSAERLHTTKSLRGLNISPFEVFIAEAQ